MSELRDDDLIGAAAIGALLGRKDFMAAWLGMTSDERIQATHDVGAAVRRTLIRGMGGTPPEQESNVEAP